MKKVLLSVIVLLVSLTTALAQPACDKKVVYHSERQELVGTDGQVSDSKTDVADIEVSKESIVVTIAGKSDELTATVKKVSCDWTKPYQEGMVVYEATFRKGNGETSEGKLIVKAKEGKITVTFEIEAMNGRKLRAIVSSYNEK